MSLQTPGRNRRRILFAVYGAALLYFVLKQCYYIFCVGGFPDQTAHISYLIYAVKYPFRLPDFRAMTMYQYAGETGGMSLFTPLQGVPDYLGHPPLYYWLMSLPGGVRLQPDGSALVSQLRLDLGNVVLSTGALALAFSLGYRKLETRSPLVHALYAFAVASLPMVAYVGASLNNDNLALLAMAVFFAGLLRYQEDRLDLKTYLLLGIGFLLGAFSKLTTALLMVILLLACLVLDIVRTKSLRLVANRWFLFTLPCYLLFLAYELYILRNYGTWVPGLSEIAPDYFMTTVFYVPPEQREPITFLQYLRRFVGGMGYSWSSLYGHNREVNPLMDNGLYGIIYWIPVAGAALAAVRSLRPGRGREDRLSLPVMASFLLTMGYHLYSNWSGYAETGYLGGIQARYYLPMIIPVAFLACSRIPPMFKKRRTFGKVLAVLLLLGWIAGDGFRLLITYGFQPAV